MRSFRVAIFASPAFLLRLPLKAPFVESRTMANVDIKALCGEPDEFVGRRIVSRVATPPGIAGK
jgi:hypothetical protein